MSDIGVHFFTRARARHNLPPVFQEAVDFTRALGVRYLWIDSLCILQDDREEWAVEAQRMAGIFENSFLTLTFHQDCAGCPVLPDIISTFKVGSINAHLRRTYGVGQDIEGGHPSKRGWCFQATGLIHFLPLFMRLMTASQERLLSSRIVTAFPRDITLNAANQIIRILLKANAIIH